MSAEQCRLCTDPKTETFLPSESIPLCQRHWNRWLAQFLGNDDAPCGAHLIRPKETP